MIRKNIISFLIFLAFLFNLGGIAYLIYDHHIPFAVAAVIVAAVAAKPVWKRLKEML